MTLRKAHRLKGYTNVQIPSNICLFDTETTQEVLENGETRHKLKMGWACFLRYRKRDQSFTEEWFEFTEIAQFWKWFISKLRSKTKTYLVAHNVIFDYTILDGFNQMYREAFDIKSIYEQSRTVIIRYEYNSRSVLVLDNMNFFKSSLQQLGKEIGLDKGEIDFRTASDKELSIYCRLDVQILVETWKKYITWIRENDLGNFGATIAGQAFTAFTHRFLDTEIFIHDREPVLNDERASYFGGRTEAFRIGEIKESDICIVDVNSMYPYVMKGELYPVKLKASEYHLNPRRLAKELEDNLAVAFVGLNTDYPLYPKRFGDKLIFPVGQFDTSLSTPELKLAIERGHLEKVYNAHFYDGKPIFDSYVDFFYSQKVEAGKKGHSAEKYLNKLFLNSLYGKFGQRSTKWTKADKADPKKVSIVDIYNADLKTWYTEYTFGGFVWWVDQGGESFNSFPAIASHVTSHARVYLVKLIEIAGWDNVYYCDTDSLFTNKKGRQNLTDYLNESELGMLGVQQEVKYLNIRGCKDYIADDLEKVKGRSKNAVEIAPGVYKQEHWATFKTLLREGNLADYKVYPVVKRYSREYTKGLVLASGKVTPYRFSQNSPESVLNPDSPF